MSKKWRQNAKHEVCCFSRKKREREENTKCHYHAQACKGRRKSQTSQSESTPGQCAAKCACAVACMPCLPSCKANCPHAKRWNVMELPAMVALLRLPSCYAFDAVVVGVVGNGLSFRCWCSFSPHGNYHAMPCIIPCLKNEKEPAL